MATPTRLYDMGKTDEHPCHAAMCPCELKLIEWNTGAGSVTRTTSREGSVNFPPPNFLPSTLSDSMTALMGPTPQPAPTTAGPPAQLSLPSHPASKRSRSGDGQQGSKRARV
ncbi:hypothetical protein KCU83_g1117, partial [Aureobasidium melanogenum]